MLVVSHAADLYKAFKSWSRVLKELEWTENGTWQELAGGRGDRAARVSKTKPKHRPSSPIEWSDY